MNQLPVGEPLALRGLSTKAGVDAMVLSTVSFALAMGAVGLRYWAKCIIKRKWTDHDWLILVSLIFAAGYYVGGVASLYPGLVGMHIQNAIMLGPGPIQLTFKLFYTSKFTWVTTTTLTKLSMLHFYRGIFQKDRVQDLSFRFYRWGAVTIYAASVLFWLIHIIMGFAECKPLALEWDKTLPGSCLDVKKQEIADTTTNAIFDFSIMVLPLPILWSLNLPFKKKAGITGILSFALIINAANIARLVFILKGDPIDFTYEAAKIGTAAALEINVGITCACLPTLGPIIFLRRARESQKPKYLYSRSGSSKWRKVRDPDDSILKTKGDMTTYDDEVALRDLEDQRSFGQESSPRV